MDTLAPTRRPYEHPPHPVNSRTRRGAKARRTPGGPYAWDVPSAAMMVLATGTVIAPIR